MYLPPCQCRTASGFEITRFAVRDLAEALMVALYRAEDRDLVRRLLPPNDQEAQRQPLYRRLFAKFDRLDGYQPSAAAKPATTAANQKPDIDVDTAARAAVIALRMLAHARREMP
ncbi:unnamed protein product [Dibothriocephalus latus]|uniref:Uncharacterized protein n=1 Tax=Dibothriocephalus latus TaxID=60516 RepID=A0A3P7LZL8_DIBLA|nr:unnamed protein product [Dibothriocephalus latus]